MSTENPDFRILVIDDNIEIHKDFIKVLTKNSVESSEFEEMRNIIFDKENVAGGKNIYLPVFKIDTASQGQEGVELIAEAIKQGDPYALAFVDIRMPPGWDGVETIKHIWELDKDMQIVICTAFSDYSWEETMEQLGQSDNLLILKKPFDHIAVRQLAFALTQKWKLMQESRQYTQSLEKSVQERTEELQHQATHDALTELPNRVLLHERIRQAITHCEKNNTYFALLFFDLDRFKLINDSLSHAAGDKLLSSVSKRLKATVRDFDTLARLGGDEFVMIVTDLKQKEDVSSIATNILSIIKQPFQIDGHDIVITSSIGICVYPKDGTTVDELLRNADAAMYFAKFSGADQYRFYSAEMNEKSLLQLELASDLHQAIEKNELTLWYQPEIDVKTNKLKAVEALVRWNHPKRGIILPLDFIPLAEQIGLIVDIGEWVLREACRQNKFWQDSGYPHLRIAVNITSQQLRQTNFVQVLKKILDETGLDPQFLELELSESCIINNLAAIKTINRIKELGVEISVDDFGTGYSSLNYLRNLSLDRLKIDRSFIQNIHVNRGDEVIIHAIIAMARSLNLEVLAEGVETQNQLEFLQKQNVTEIQGFYFSKPLSKTDLTELLKDKNAIKKNFRT